MPKITFKDVSVYYQGKKKEIRTVFEHLNLTLDSGLVHVFIGPSGCGKTTLLKTLYDGVDYHGEITFDDINIEETQVKDRNMAYLSQNYALYPSMTIFDNIAFPLKMMGASSEEIKKRVYDIASELDITMCLSRKPKHLSGGQQQRVALARALVKNPSLCLLDEPLSNLDQNSSYLAKELIINSLKKRHVTSLYVTHDITEATSVADVIHVMNEGEMIFNGSVEELLASKNPLLMSMVDER